MRRLLTTLAVLLVVLTAGMTALVVLINPNDFRSYMVKQVAARSGYRLNLDGELRWHVWPQLSILSGGMSLSTPGAAQPFVSAENMRLDVKLWPLLSHRLEVKQVMLKGAVIRLTPESAAARSGSAPIAPGGSAAPTEESHWRLDINRVAVVDGLLMFQRDGSDQINVRDLNLQLDRTNAQQVRVALSSRINRDQRDLSFNLNATLDMKNYPQQVGASIEQFDYQLQGAGIPPEGIAGKGSLQGSYQSQPEKVTVSQFSLSANNSQLTGSAAATLAAVPDYQLSLQSPRLDLDALLGLTKSAGGNGGDDKPAAAKPVISSKTTVTPYAGLRDFTARVTVQADNLIYRGLPVTRFALQGANQRGVASLTTLSGQLGDGHFSLPGRLDVNADPIITAQPVLQDLELSPLLHAFNLPEALSGKLSLQGVVSGDELSWQSLFTQWQGQAALQASTLRLQGLNIQQLIQQAVERNDSGVRGEQDYPRYTEVQQISGQATLDSGNLRLANLNGRSERLQLGGSGQLDLSGRTCDTTLTVKVVQGWQGDENLVRLLQDTEIPFRLYGSWDQLNYQLQVDQILRKRLQDEMKKRLDEWRSKNQPNQKNDGVKTLLDKL